MNTFKLSQPLTSNGIKVAMVLVTAKVNNRRSGSLERYISDWTKQLSLDELMQSPILAPYKVFYAQHNLDVLPPAEHLLAIIKRSGRLPNINNAVDCANIVSVESLLSFGVHDADHIVGDVYFKTTDGTEHYTPLGKTEHEKVNADEYACMDQEKILCRMDIKNCDETKITKETKQFIVYAQGNSATTQEYVKENLLKACELIKQFCEGEYVVLDGEITL